MAYGFAMIFTFLIELFDADIQRQAAVFGPAFQLFCFIGVVALKVLVDLIFYLTLLLAQQGGQGDFVL